MHPVAYSPSASLFQFYSSKGSGKLNSCASFGIANTPEEVLFLQEAQKIAELFNTKPYLNVTKNTVIKNMSNDVLHFSCHGLFDNSDPLSSKIMLYNADFTVRELFNLELRTELMTLSACQTGISKRRAGDELIGLTRALIYAGAPSIIVTLWSVDAASAQELMIEFYRLLREGKDKASALQQAQTKIREKEEYSHPYIWAPFILIGDWD